MRFPQALSNQCSSNRIHTTRLHLNTSLLSWLFNSLLLSLTRTYSLCLFLIYTISLFCFLYFSPSTLSSLSLLLLMVKCSWLAAAQPYTTQQDTHLTLVAHTVDNIVIIATWLVVFFFFYLYIIQFGLFC